MPHRMADHSSRGCHKPIPHPIQVYSTYSTLSRMERCGCFKFRRCRSRAYRAIYYHVSSKPERHGIFQTTGISIRLFFQSQFLFCQYSVIIDLCTTFIDMASSSNPTAAATRACGLLSSAFPGRMVLQSDSKFQSQKDQPW